jgi:hypothetical protein
VAILYKPEAPAKGKRLSLRWRFGLVKNCHPFSAAFCLLHLNHREKRNFKKAKAPDPVERIDSVRTEALRAVVLVRLLLDGKNPPLFVRSLTLVP